MHSLGPALSPKIGASPKVLPTPNHALRNAAAYTKRANIPYLVEKSAWRASRGRLYKEPRCPDSQLKYQGKPVSDGKNSLIAVHRPHEAGRVRRAGLWAGTDGARRSAPQALRHAGYRDSFLRNGTDTSPKRPACDPRPGRPAASHRATGKAPSRSGRGCRLQY